MSGLLAALGLLAVVAGVPTVLIARGAVPDVHGIVEAISAPSRWAGGLRRPLSDTLLAAGAVWAAWWAWAYLATCVLVDVVARVRGRAPARVPAGHRMQAIVAGLVGAVLAVAPMPRSSNVRLQPVAMAAELTATVGAADPAPVGAADLATVGAADPAPDPAPDPVGTRLGEHGLVRIVDVPSGAAEYVVQPGDTLWSIAERELGSPLRWPEIGDLNRGVPQPDGSSLADDNWLLPGWHLLLPKSAPVLPTAASVDLRSTVDVAKPASPDAAGTPAPSSPSPPLPSPSATKVSSAPPSNPTSSEPAGRRGAHLPVAPIGYGILGAGVVVLLDRARRAQQRRRPDGMRIRLPDAELTELERGLRASADLPLADDVDTGLRLLLSTVRLPGRRPPAVLALRCTPDMLEFTLQTGASVVTPPPPFQPSPDGSRWDLSREWLRQQGTALSDVVRGVDVPVPALVTVAGDGLVTLLVDLEAAGSLCVSGADAAMVVEALVAELCTVPWADCVDVLLIGHASETRALDRLRRAASAAAVVPEVRRRVAAQQALATGDAANRVSDGRWSNTDACWDPLVVICTGQTVVAEREAVHRLVDLVGDGSAGVALVLGADVPGARWSVVADSGPVELSWREGAPSTEGAPTTSPLTGGAALRPQPTPPGLLAGVASLVESAIAPADRPADPPACHSADPAACHSADPPADPFAGRSADPPVERPTGSPAAFSALQGGARPDQPSPRHPQAQVEVLLLGPVTVKGAARPFARAWALELVVYLATHPEGVANERWATALWPDRLMAPASLHSTASAARRALGVAPDGSDHLPKAKGRLALGPGVTSDMAVFERLSASSRPTDWEAALGLVRGRPLDGLRCTDWAVLEGVLASMESEVVDVASRFAEWCLANGDPRRAEWSARQGLKVSEYDERLYRILLRASDAAGNPAGVEAAMRELVTLVADGVEPYDAVHPETLELYRSLSRRNGVRRGA